jgi:NAD(P)-dependent dehydrogenase (short-subunit alcohol dehydrogenase family)
MRVVVTGANRGIGLELCRQLQDRGDQVEAGARQPEQASALQELAARPGVHVHALDVQSDASVAAFAAGLASEDPRPLDLLINNAGYLGAMTPLEGLDLDDVRLHYEINTLGPIRVTRALLPLLRRGGARRGGLLRKVVHVTSRMGSIADNTSGGAYGYRLSKAALNMASKSMAIELRSEVIASVVINPGWVQTDMGGRNAPTAASDCVQGLLQVIDGLKLEQTGAFLDYRGGAEVPW